MGETALDEAQDGKLNQPSKDHNTIIELLEAATANVAKNVPARPL